jgi:FO synthase subunit 2
MNPALKTLLDDVIGGHRLSVAEANRLFRVHDRDIWKIAEAADTVREQRVGNDVTYVLNQNINVTGTQRKRVTKGRISMTGS